VHAIGALNRCPFDPMRSPDAQQFGMFSYVWVEESVSIDHPICDLHVLALTSSRLVFAIRATWP
jgi:hypothetical protein